VVCTLILQANPVLGNRDGARWRAAPRLSLRARLLLLVVASVMPLLAFSLGSQYLQYRQAVDSTGQRTLELARSMTQVVEQELQARMVALQVLALSPALRGDDIAGFREQAQAVIAQQFPGSNLILLREDGQQLMNTLLPPQASLPVRPNLESLRQVFATAAPAVSDLYMGAIGPRLVVAIDVPVKRDDGSVAYVLSTNPVLEDFAAIIRRQQLRAGWLVSVFDRHGINVARTPNSERFVGLPASADMLGHLLAEREAKFENVSREGIELVSAFSHSARFGWGVAVGVPRAELTAPAVSAATRTLAAGAILLALSLIMALLVARQITGPIAALRQLAGTGGGAAPAGTASAAGASTGLRETDEVARALIAAEADREASDRDKARARAALGESEEKLRQSQKMEAVGQLTGGLAHDFNNLLLVIIGSLDDLIDSKNNAPAEQDLARQALEAAQRGADLIRSLLAFARRQPLQPRRIAINDLMRTIAKLLARTLGERIAVTLELAPDVWPVVADPAQLEAALTNLATNARDAMPRGGRLTIATANRHLDEDYGSQHAEVVPGDYAVIEVSDTGSGIPPELLTQIFDPFFTTKPQGEGTGLGLSMVFGFMKQSGGHINVYSEPSAGTTFRLYLPRDRTADLPHRESDTASPQGGGETVLVVEDNPTLRAMVVMQLTRLGYRVRQSESAAAAITVLEQAPQRIDLLFADVVMPGKLDGYDLARIVRQRWPATGILMTSGFPGTKLDHATTVAADIPLLTKPYRRAALAQALRAALGNGRPGKPPASSWPESGSPEPG
jgi:signal transduction histidine kinase/ActR/RegA family two-component response regulator